MEVLSNTTLKNIQEHKLLDEKNGKHDYFRSFLSLINLAKKDVFIYIFPMAYKSDSGGEPTCSQETKKLQRNLG